MSRLLRPANRTLPTRHAAEPRLRQPEKWFHACQSAKYSCVAGGNPGMVTRTLTEVRRLDPMNDELALLRGRTFQIEMREFRRESAEGWDRAQEHPTQASSASTDAGLSHAVCTERNDTTLRPFRCRRGDSADDSRIRSMAEGRAGQTIPDLRPSRVAWGLYHANQRPLGRVSAHAATARCGCVPTSISAGLVRHSHRTGRRAPSGQFGPRAARHHNL